MDKTQFGICVLDCHVYSDRDHFDRFYLRPGTMVQIIGPENMEIHRINIFHINYETKGISLIDKIYLCDKSAIEIVPLKIFRFLVSVRSLDDRLVVYRKSNIISNLKISNIIELDKSYQKYFHNIMCKILYIGEVPEMGIGDFIGIKLMNCVVPLMITNMQKDFSLKYIGESIDSLFIPITDLIKFYVREIRQQPVVMPMPNTNNVVQSHGQNPAYTCTNCKAQHHIIHLRYCNHKMCKACIMQKFENEQMVELNCSIETASGSVCNAAVNLEHFMFLYHDLELLYDEIIDNNRISCYNCGVKSDDNGNVIQISDCDHTICMTCAINLLEESPPKDYCTADDDGEVCREQFNEALLNTFIPIDDLEEYRERKILHILETTPNSFRCKTRKCYFYWVNYEKAYTKFYCKSCKLYNCLTCDAVHKASCREYEHEILDGTDEDKKIALRAKLTSDELAAHDLVRQCKVESYAKAEIVCILRQKNANYEEEDLLWAVKQSDAIELIEKLLNVECRLCQMTYAHNKMFSMLSCGHEFCNNCAKTYFTIQITDKPILQCVCPDCMLPQLEEESDESEYMELLDTVLRNLVEPQVYDIFSRKNRDRALARLDNFKWCVKCDYGFEVNRNVGHAACEKCKTVFCVACNEIWQEQHANITCEQFKQWKKDNNPTTQAEGVVDYLEENGIECPSPTCKFKYSLAKGGCLHFTCTQCKHEFCYGCRQPFLRGARCTKYNDCATKGIHAHHPRNCISILRDCSIALLENLMTKANLNFNGIPPNGATCQIPIQKETPNGLVDVLCEKQTHNATTGLCDQHYQEGIVDVLFKAKIDPADILDLGECQGELIRNHVEFPARLANDTDATYRDKCIALIKASIPIV